MSGWHEKLGACVALSKALTETLDREEVVGIIFKRLCELIKATNWSLYLVDHERQEMRFEVVAGLEADRLRGVQIKLGEGIAGATALSGEPAFIRDEVGRDPHFCHKVDTLTGFVTHSLICLPLKVRGRVIGVLELVNPEDRTLFDEASRPMMSILADFMAIAIVNANNFRHLETISLMAGMSMWSSCPVRASRPRSPRPRPSGGPWPRFFFWRATGCASP
jgi:sigma-B regulation protein RsbU (phosphoserine phosphatase)